MRNVPRKESFDDKLHFTSAQGGALRSLSEMGAMLTMFTTGIKPSSVASVKDSNKVCDTARLTASSSLTACLLPLAKASGSSGGTKAMSSKKEDNFVMDTKLKIIDILQFIMDVRLDYRISCLLSIFKREFDESEKSERCVVHCTV